MGKNLGKQYRRILNTTGKYHRRRFGRLIERLLDLFGKDIKHLAKPYTSKHYSTIDRYIDGVSLPRHDGEIFIAEVANALGCRPPQRKHIRNRIMRMLSQAAERDYEEYEQSRKPKF